MSMLCLQLVSLPLPDNHLTKTFMLVSRFICHLSVYNNMTDNKQILQGQHVSLTINCVHAISVFAPTESYCTLSTPSCCSTRYHFLYHLCLSWLRSAKRNCFKYLKKVLNCPPLKLQFKHLKIVHETVRYRSSHHPFAAFSLRSKVRKGYSNSPCIHEI